MAIFKCKMCGGDLNVQEGITVCECEYCGTKQTVPMADNEKKVNAFNRANHLRSSCEFDKAAGVYESIVSEFPEESEAYWGLCLCKFGIEYVDDPASGKKIPTCHRTSYDSIFEDSNFEQALEWADSVAHSVYRAEAKEIDRLQKEILEIAKNEQPFDVFICYKESDENGQRTVDSELAHDIYDVLTEKGYKVFYSRITLKAKLGQDYEPYIFSALNSAKVMLAIGTKYEYYNAVWVKNEWSRYLALMSKDSGKTLIPCYRDIDAYDMNKVKSILAKTIKEENINILEIDEHIDELSVKLRNEINITLDDYGLTMPEFFVTAVMTPDDDPNFKRLKQQFADKTLRVREEEIRKAEAEAAQGRRLVEAQTEAQLKMVGAQGEAEALKIKAMAEAEAYKAQAFAEAEEMKAKGYTYQQETARQVGLEAMQNGITGNGSGGASGGFGDLASLGVTLGAMDGVMNMTKDALNPILNTANDVGSGIGNGLTEIVKSAENSWNCSCGAMNITSNFCPDCGAKKPEPPAAWDCPNCGCKGITSKFCPDCGSPKPAAPSTWDCKKCGQTGITSNFCPNCGTKKE